MKLFDDEDLKNKVLKDFEDEQDNQDEPFLTAPIKEEEPEQTEEKKEEEVLSTPYDFRAEYKERISVPESEETKKSSFKFFTLGWHMVGIAALGGGLLVLLIVAFILGLSDDEKAEPIVIEEDAIVIKEKPVNAGGMEVPDRDKTVYKRMRSEQVDSKIERLFPAEETPKVVSRPATKEGLILGTPAAGREELEVLSVPPSVEKETQKVAETKPAPVVEKPTEVVPKTVAKVEQPVKAVAKTAPVTKPAPAKVESGTWSVQLVSLLSKAGAEKEWPKILKAHSALLSGYTHRVVQAQIPNKGTYYRLVVGSFKTRDEAKNLCDKLKARNQNCTVIKP